MEAKEFERRFSELKREFTSDAANRSSYKLEGCERCTSCVFCERCELCYRCTYCTECTASSHLTHCIKCRTCHHLANSFDCSSCTGSAYLVLCTDMSECNYCFGCVGLVRKDFHILNQPYERTEYFEVTNRLKKQLRIP